MIISSCGFLHCLREIRDWGILCLGGISAKCCSRLAVFVRYGASNRKTCNKDTAPPIIGRRSCRLCSKKDRLSVLVFIIFSIASTSTDALSNFPMSVSYNLRGSNHHRRSRFTSADWLPVTCHVLVPYVSVFLFGIRPNALTPRRMLHQLLPPYFQVDRMSVIISLKAHKSMT